MPELAERIRAWRLAAGLSQVEVARVIEVTPSAVTQWELGLTQPRQKHLDGLIRAIGVTHRIFWGDLPRA